MKYMGWGWSDYLDAPVYVVKRIVEILNEQSEAAAAAESARHP